ncbi:hypothetical protein FK530_18055 [Tsukamurella conjunctivitidis]|uniref:Uncharacterized protein n=1 Tax=Tsukamurella conjunctivitidis TaxID=2592068 RepID=A0A5C5RXD7_9ACTN|nr:hypothetical protein [Tsukamurella conjunctivitidis]TWS27432.1 hypothetical protein FK530_18055 [Tsukamurella conjunctivitidis]
MTSAESVRKWFRKAQVDAGERTGITSSESEEVRRGIRSGFDVHAPELVDAEVREREALGLDEAAGAAAGVLEKFDLKGRVPTAKVLAAALSAAWSGDAANA